MKRNVAFMLLSCVAMLVSLLVGCHPERPTKPDVAEKSGYVRRANNDTVIVFVHGVFGGPRSTWTNDRTGAYWPEMLVRDDGFANTDIYVLGYETPYLSSSFSLDDLIEHARLRFDNDEIFSKHKNVIFVCHSMGGLVVRGFIKRYQGRAPQVTLLYFLSTPTAGAHIAHLASLISKNPQLAALMPADADNFVTTLQHDWRALPVHPLSKCAFETKNTYGIRIVDEQSAAALCDGSLDPIEEDHIGIAKPADRDSTAYIAFRQAYLDASKPREVPTSAPTVPDLITGHVEAVNKIEVDCGEVKENLAEIAPPLDLREGQKVVGAVASLQDMSNLKHGEVSLHGVQNQKASVYYRLEGLDRGTGGTCAAKGGGILVTAFILSQPRSLPLPLGFQTLTAADLSLTILNRPGALRIYGSPGRIPLIENTGVGLGKDPWVLVGWSPGDKPVMVKASEAKPRKEIYDWVWQH